MVSLPEDNGGSMNSKSASIENLKNIHGFLYELDKFITHHDYLSSDIDDFKDSILAVQDHIEQVVSELKNYGEDLTQ